MRRLYQCRSCGFETVDLKSLRPYKGRNGCASCGTRKFLCPSCNGLMFVKSKVRTPDNENDLRKLNKSVSPSHLKKYKNTINVKKTPKKSTDRIFKIKKI